MRWVPVLAAVLFAAGLAHPSLARPGLAQQEAPREDGIAQRLEAGLQLDYLPLWNGSVSVRSFGSWGGTAHVGYALREWAGLRGFLGHAPGGEVDGFRWPDLTYWGWAFEVVPFSAFAGRLRVTADMGNAVFEVGTGSGRISECSAACAPWDGPAAFEADRHVRPVAGLGVRVAVAPRISLRLERRHFFRKARSGHLTGAGLMLRW